MKAWTDLVSTDYGLMSLIVIVLIIYMSVWFARFFKRHMDEDAAAAERQDSSAKR